MNNHNVLHITIAYLNNKSQYPDPIQKIQARFEIIIDIVTYSDKFETNRQQGSEFTYDYSSKDRTVFKKNRLVFI